MAHLFYPELWPEVRAVLASLEGIAAIHVSLTQGTSDHLASTIAGEMAGAEVTVHENRGRDAAPFTAIVPRLVDDGIDVALKIHGKRSPQLSIGDEWRVGLLRALVPDRDGAQAVIGRFAADGDLGMAIPLAFTQPLTLHLRDNRRLVAAALSSTVSLFDVAVLHDEGWLASHVFPRGNMFWFRPRALEALGHITAAEFGSEDGAMDGTMAHAVERIPAVLAALAGYTVESYDVPPAAGLPPIPAHPS